MICCYVVSPQRIVLGGGVLAQPGLLARVRRRVPGLLKDYLPRAATGSQIERFIVAPHFGQEAGLFGAFALAQGLVATGSQSGG